MFPVMKPRRLACRTRIAAWMAAACLHAIVVSALFFLLPSVREDKAGTIWIALPQAAEASSVFEPVARDAQPTRHAIPASQQPVVASNEGVGSPIAMPIATHYFETRALTQKPLVAVDVPSQLNLPADAPAAVTMDLMISEYGDVDDAQVRESELPEDAAESLRKMFLVARFHPGEIDGVPVKSHMRIVVRLDALASQEQDGQ